MTRAEFKLVRVGGWVDGWLGGWLGGRLDRRVAAWTQ